ncbi:MAG: glycosyltransferase family 2 protein [Acidobacteriia bacterium]|nr:glycosyltransferase family 2 protein [Terriglobia bacterium]
MAMAPLITVSLVTFNSRDEIERCLQCLDAQSLQDFEVRIWDNASTDGTVEFLKSLSLPRLSLFCSGTNVGFCAAHNHIIEESGAEFVLVLNPDCYLESHYLEAAVGAARKNPCIGAVAGKLYRLRTPSEDFEVARREGILDSTGTYFTPSFRHFDRGSNEVEGGRYSLEEWVFGVTGAAGFYRRGMLEDIQIDGEYFDEAFFAYREDADLAWRMQSAGWQCLYTPQAVGYHVRKVFPAGRSRVAEAINMHSVKNRFLFRLNNVAWPTCVRFFLPMAVRDIGVLGYTILFEHSSLPGLSNIARNFRARWKRRQKIQSKRKVSLSSLHRWIHWRPTAFPKETSLQDGP